MTTPLRMPEGVHTLGRHPAPRHTIAHLSDTHLLADTLQYGVVDTRTHLECTLTRLARVDPVPEALVITGDLADAGEPAAYALLREAVEPIAADLGAQVIWTMGNHDERPAYSQGLFGAPSSEPQDRVHHLGGLRVIALDTSVPGWHHGELSEGQLDWLAAELSAPAAEGTVLAMHHPPLPSPALPLAALIELHGQDRLAAVLAGTDVRAILAGHLHYTTFGAFAGIPVSVASATCYTSELVPDRRLLAGVDGHQAFTLTHLYDAGHGPGAVFSVVPAVDAPEVDGYDADLLDALLALDPETRHDLVSRKDSPLNTGQLAL